MADGKEEPRLCVGAAVTGALGWSGEQSPTGSVRHFVGILLRAVIPSPR